VERVKEGAYAGFLTAADTKDNVSATRGSESHCRRVTTASVVRPATAQCYTPIYASIGTRSLLPHFQTLPLHHPGLRALMAFGSYFAYDSVGAIETTLIQVFHTNRAAIGTMYTMYSVAAVLRRHGIRFDDRHSKLGSGGLPGRQRRAA